MSAAHDGALPWNPAGSRFWYRVIRRVVWIYLTIFHRLHVRNGNRDLAPALNEGGLLVVANHASFLDIPIVANSLTRHISFVARDTLAESRFIAWVIRVSGGILIRPGESDRAALRAIGERLEAGYAVAIFPEGTRSLDGRLGPFRGGALFAARRSRVPILPIGIRGTFEAFSRRHKLPRPRPVESHVGTAIAADGSGVEEHIREAIQALMGHTQSTPSSSGASVTS